MTKNSTNMAFLQTAKLSACGFAEILAITVVATFSLCDSVGVLGGVVFTPEVNLASGYTMPLFGFGTAKLKEKSLEAISTAAKLGYRLIDTAMVYNVTTEESSEAVVGKVIEESGIPREEFFIVTKIVPQVFGKDECRRAIQRSLERLRTSYIDLVLIHTPVCYFHGCIATGTYIDGWKSLEELVDKGWIRSIGVSNYDIKEIMKTSEIARHPISVVQNWFDPFQQDKSTVDYCNNAKIVFMGYSTLGGVWLDQFQTKNNPVLTSDVIQNIAKNHDRTASQVVLAWAMRKGVVVIPGTTKQERMAKNLGSLSLNLTDEDVSIIDALDGIDPRKKESVMDSNDEL